MQTLFDRAIEKSKIEKINLDFVKSYILTKKKDTRKIKLKLLEIIKFHLG